MCKMVSLVSDCAHQRHEDWRTNFLIKCFKNVVVFLTLLFCIFVNFDVYKSLLRSAYTCWIVIVGGGSGMSMCVMHCEFRYMVQTPGRILHCISCTIDLSRKNFSILNRQWHNHGLPSMRTVLSDLRCDSSSAERQSRSLSRKSSVSSRGNIRKTSGSMYTKSHLEKRERDCVLQ